ncbi:hypothetical protein Naga_100294g2 [Nannochloropsis gaditana]|uniref:Uncharacterized protein n=1 Tax=Nannochloropsis gaditana TaxID=72520 RepID=W7TW38_9STRA|nr:hypothetical protein Naga_100294g2 [Nannochloropsis gaditana]
MTGGEEERHRRRREAKTVGRFEPGGLLASIVRFTSITSTGSWESLGPCSIPSYLPWLFARSAVSMCEIRQIMRNMECCWGTDV